MDTFLRDLRFGIRMALKHPVLSLIVILTFGLGIGLTTTVFSIVNGALFKGLPIPHAGRLMLSGRSDSITSDQGFPLVSALYVQDFREQQTVFRGLAAFAGHPVNISEGEGRPERLTAGYFTANALDVLGRTVKVNGETRTIVGVMPPRFGFPYREQIWMPLVMDAPAGPQGQALQDTAFGPLKAGRRPDEQDRRRARRRRDGGARRARSEHHPRQPHDTGGPRRRPECGVMGRHPLRARDRDGRVS